MADAPVPDRPAGEAAGSGLAALLAMPVGRVVRPVPVLDADTPLGEAVASLEAQVATALPVRCGRAVGVVSAAALAAALASDGGPAATVAAAAEWDPPVVPSEGAVAAAVALAAEHRGVPVLVRDGEHTVGVFTETDLLHLIAGDPTVADLRVGEAATHEQLRAVSAAVDRVAGTLHAAGADALRIAAVVSGLRDRLFAALFRLVAPADLAADSCLFVAGSEGRHEQILRTDQDNGLILRHPVPEERLDPVRRAFTGTLLEFGYPPCPGDIMVSNPAWSKPLEAFRDDLRSWILLHEDKASLNLAIFYDAAAVAGDASLLAEARQAMFDLLGDDDAFYADFARAIDTFETPHGLIARLRLRSGSHAGTLDLKRSGIFPVVHGARSLALQRRLPETGTVDRLRRLEDAGLYDRPFADDLVEAFGFMLDLRLRVRLTRREAAGNGNIIDPHDLSTLQRAQLAESLGIVHHFKEVVRHHFKLSFLLGA